MDNPRKRNENATSDMTRPPIAKSTKSIAMTGGAGRVGKALRKALSRKVGPIKILDIADPSPLAENETWAQVDISNHTELSENLTDVYAIIHLAGHPNERGIDDILRVNVLGTHNVLEAARQNGINRVVFGSSNHAIGFYPRKTKITETDPMRPDSLYGLSKCWGELEAGLYFDKFGIRSLNIRIGNAGERPTDARSAKIWVSARDLAQLVLIGLEHPDITCTTVFGVSEVAGSWWDNSTASKLGYTPIDSANAVAGPETQNELPSPLPTISEHFQGGRFCVIDHDGTLRWRPS